MHVKITENNNPNIKIIEDSLDKKEELRDYREILFSF